MSCENLICARCAGPVAEGRCATCRSARTHVHHQGPALSVQLLLAALFIIMLALTAARLAH